MLYENIPKYLQENARFCCWRYEQNQGRQTKIPYTPATGQHAKVNKSSTFTDFATALAYVDKYSGLGLRVSGRIFGIDLDHCVSGDTIEPWARKIVAHFRKAYIEKSPSGTGLRIFTLLPEDFTYDSEIYYFKKGGIEAYAENATNRFLTVTGNVLQAGDMSVEPDAIKWLLREHLTRPKPTKTLPQLTDRESFLTDEEALAKAVSAKNGEKFMKLYHGDTEGYASQSEADLALCTYLAFWCNGDTEQMDRLFRESSLMREKWDRSRSGSTYGEITMKKAVSGTASFYMPIRTSAVDDFNDDFARLEDFHPEDRRCYPWSDIGFGHLFADFYMDRLRYVPERHSWFVYEDGVWQADVGDLKTMKLCMTLADMLYQYALKITDESIRKDYIKHISKWQARSYRTNILKDAQVHHPISASEFDADPYIFNCSNGTLHLDTGEFTEHRAEDRLSKISLVVYDPSAVSSRWDRFISEIMSGDMEKAKFLQKILGYALSGDSRHECMMILYGASTRNGKGTLCESVLRVFGNYGCTARPETIALKNNMSSSQPSEDVARLAGVRFVNIAEPGKGLVLNAAQVKSMTGNDTLNARFLHENSFDFKPQFKLYINTNYLPIINDMTVFSSGRLIIIPFDKHFDAAEQDMTLKQSFATPQTQSAILNWLVAGYDLLRSEGLNIPLSILQATDEYRHDSDKTALFLEECAEKGAEYEERASDFYHNYKEWCSYNGHYPEGIKTFKQSVSAYAKVVRKRPRAGGEKTTMIIGYRLLSDFLV